MNSLDSFSPLYKALKLFGIFPFEIYFKRGVVRVRWKGVLWMILWVVLVTYLIFLNIIQGARESGKKLQIVLSGWHWLLIFQLFATFYIQFWSLFKRKVFEDFFCLLNKFDEQVSESNNNI